MEYGYGEPADVTQRAAYYVEKIPKIPEYNWLVGAKRQDWYGVGELERLGGFSRAILRRRYQQGLILGARDEGGSSGLQVPWSAAIIHAGREITGWYRQYDAEHRAKEA